MDFILNIFSYWYSALAVILVFGGLIFFHELGHFLANRALGVGVITFSLGMGPRIWGFRHGKTDYRLSLFPFGGYVSAVGEYSKEFEELGFTEEEAIYNRPPWQRLVLAFSGPFANLLLALLIYFFLALFNGASIPLPQIGTVLPDSPAIEAGIQKGDIILSINGNPLDNWNQIPEFVGTSNGNPLILEVQRNEQVLSMTIIPERMMRTNIFGEEEEAWLLGVQAMGTVRHEELNFIGAIKTGWNQTIYVIDLTLTSLKKLVTGSVAAENVGGPILIAEMIGSQAQLGIASLLMLAALISVNLGLLNLLPIPILDGGLILFSLIEMVIRRPIPEKIQIISMNIGAFLLIALMVFATFNDVLRWFN